MRPRLLMLLTLLGLAGCAPPPTLSVDLRTDLVPGVEFATVETTIGAPDPVAFAVRGVEDATSFAGGVRLVQVPVEGAAEVLVQVRLLDDDGVEVLSRRLLADMTTSLAVTVVITRDCLNLACPGAADDPSATECAAGRCVTLGVVSAEEAVGYTPECEVDSDCPATAACVAPTCAAGACLAVPNDALCRTFERCHPDAGCETLAAPPECSVCGDVDGNGTINLTDIQLIADIAAGVARSAPCMGAYGNILGDAGDAITERDAAALGHYLFGVADLNGLCDTCDRACGDVDGDGAITEGDALVAAEIVLGTRLGSVCDTWAADVNGDHQHTMDDAAAIQAAVGGELTACVR